MSEAELAALISRLRRIDEHVDVVAIVRGWLQGGHGNRATALAAAIASDAEIAPFRKRWSLAAIDRAIAENPDPDAKETLWHHLKSMRADNPERLAAMASVLAVRFAPSVLIDRLKDSDPAGPDLELCGCWLHEAILRGEALGALPESLRLQQVLVDARHSLGALPLDLLEVERDIGPYLPAHSPAGSSVAMFSPQTDQAAVTPPVGLVRKSARFRELLLSAPLVSWQQHSNGVVETAIFSVDARGGSLHAGHLAETGLECTQGDLRFARIRPAEAWMTLFCAAAQGGAYGGALHGAHGRRAAWRAFGAMTDLGPNSRIEDIHLAMRRWSFGAFNSRNGFFHGVAWDVGLAALSPEGQTLCVLAATDTD